MKLKPLALLATLILALLPAMTLAQEYSWTRNAPERYIAANTATITSRRSPCNQGEEAFMDFIPKWRTNATFRNSRVRLNDPASETGFKYFDEYKLFKASPSKRIDKCCTRYATWYNITKDEVSIRISERCTCGESGGSDIIARFTRLSGRWYLTGLFIAG